MREAFDFNVALVVGMAQDGVVGREFFPQNIGSELEGEPDALAYRKPRDGRTIISVGLSGKNELFLSQGSKSLTKLPLKPNRAARAPALQGI